MQFITLESDLSKKCVNIFDYQIAWCLYWEGKKRSKSGEKDSFNSGL